MPEIGFTNLFLVALVAFGVPLLLGLAPGLRLPGPVLEIVAGVVLGPAVLGWVRADLPVQVLAVVGLAFLLFLAGLEIDLRGLRGRPFVLALAGFAVTLLIGLAAGVAFRAVGWVTSALLLAVTLSATSLGLVVPVLKDAGAAAGPTGQRVVAASVADVGAILLLSLFFSARSGTGTGTRIVLLGVSRCSSPRWPGPCCTSAAPAG
jgi:Kef-type K+ transport system membrane component KefB